MRGTMEDKPKLKPGIQQKDNKCIVCKKDLGNVSAAKASHMRKHVRDGSIKETKDKKSGKLIWTTTGKTKSKPVYSYRDFTTRIKAIPRMPNIGKSDTKGNIHIKCKVCKKWVVCTTKKGIHESFADPRLIAIKHCDKITVFPTRMIETLIAHPGQEYIE
jgi:hypothetical protein